MSVTRHYDFNGVELCRECTVSSPCSDPISRWAPASQGYDSILATFGTIDAPVRAASTLQLFLRT